MEGNSSVSEELGIDSLGCAQLTPCGGYVQELQENKNE